jgi:pimeloyl-ACP methyl ester carboxylesterase
MLYAARHPEAVERVVAMGPLPVQAAQMGPPDRPIDHGLEAERAELAAMEADGRMASDPYAYCVLEAYVGGSASHVDIEAMRIPAKGNGCQYPNDRPDRVLPVVFEGIIGSFGEWDWSDQVASVTQPTVLLFGDHEAWPQAGVQAYAPLLQDVGWLEVERSGHAVWNDANELVLEMLDTFFRGAWPDGVNR